ncbi:SDR family oxidoreductase [Chitinophaga polysaccharea]|uniref:SDR family NAD(P)-dependent oxidoreductase n=1 Tax=Chitinophaga TaxID=79328 RepID=UPI00145540B1|nr:MULTISPECIES: SDR family oxidoreductase [Chitinophaga]NLR57380.1 SDR family oxidoreductase [Chitinophaga polysaccharea]NLU92532.1 SDR family oxidoreductase [Chitinophaga sp. Ak27]
MKKLFEQKTVLISGGLGDIGRATALAFAAQGAQVAIGDIQPAAQAQPLLQELSELGVQGHYTCVDVADAAAVDAWVAEATAQLGLIHMVVANAATVTIAGLYHITAEQWTKELRINLDGAFYVSRAVTSHLLSSQMTGSVVFVGSWAAEAVHPNIPAYAVSKAGMRMLCQCMALELAPHGIMVNEIAPGYVDAGVSRQVWEQAPAQRDEARKKVPVKALITPEEVAQQVLRLCDPGNKHITGSILLMDGGLSLLR